MNNYNPYKVPENFFQTTRDNAVAKYRRVRRAVLLGSAAAIVAATLICLPIFHSADNQVKNSEMSANNLAGLYEYDIFLQVNFTE